MVVIRRNPTESDGNPTESDGFQCFPSVSSLGIRRNPTESDGIRRIWLQPKTIRRKSAENPPKIRRNSVGIRRKFMWIGGLPPESAGIRRNPTESDGFYHFPHAPRWGIRRNPSESVENPTESGGFTSGRTSNSPKFAESAEIRRNPCTSQPNPPESVGIRRNPTDSCFFVILSIEKRWKFDGFRRIP